MTHNLGDVTLCIVVSAPSRFELNLCIVSSVFLKVILLPL
jgi:hypothetical protein